MPEEGFKRKLTAILSADVQGYSRLMGEDEGATVRTLTAYREVMTTIIHQHKGKVLDSPGDNLLAEFVSPVDAVQCAVAVQKEINARYEELPENRKMRFRIGINLGDVIEEKDRIYGDGVNIAARLESLADPGGIAISGTAFDNVRNNIDCGYQFLGEHTVKNIANPVRIYKVLTEQASAGRVIGGNQFLGWMSRKSAMAAILTLFFLAVFGSVCRFISLALIFTMEYSRLSGFKIVITQKVPGGIVSPEYLTFSLNRRFKKGGNYEKITFCSNRNFNVFGCCHCMVRRGNKIL
ncbi:FIG140336: TPR domain protein [Olavius sp. associated proteobacterium Delta 1]|nr:FIG140336: TPR domain protein [Olavius sp. associated proteobacterium Delta 1]